MQHAWLCGSVAVLVEEIDFQDPAERGPDVRERGLRIELHTVRDRSRSGSVYSSTGREIAPAACRVDVLESAPGARDRIHWHPTMTDGEPGDRVVDEELARDPAGWVRRHLADPVGLLDRAGIQGADARTVDGLRAAAGEVADRVERGLAAMCRPWPDVVHDERGLAVPD
ncbi:hypothetical protein [Pseudonocardia alni]|uniref:hypothetical protein n=1 Tax=Pseudonocardia alni TaxID=33907 RepID=UPI003323D030